MNVPSNLVGVPVLTASTFLVTTLITVPAVGTATVIEILWTLFGIGGLAVVTPNLWAAVHNMDVVAAAPREERPAAAIVIRGAIRRELIRVVILLLLVIVGIVAMGQGSSPMGNKTTVTGLFVTFVFFGVSALVVAQSVLDKRDSRLVRALAAKRWEA